MGSCGANRREFEDQNAIKGNFEQNGIRPSWSLILGEPKREEEERRREEVEEEEERKPRKVWKLFMYGNYLSMDDYDFVWISME